MTDVEIPSLDHVNHEDAEERSGRLCPAGGTELGRLECVHRTSWRDIVSSKDCPSWYAFREAPE